MAKLTVAKVEFDGQTPRVFLSNGDELGGLTSIGMDSVCAPADVQRGRLAALILPKKD